MLKSKEHSCSRKGQPSVSVTDTTQELCLEDKLKYAQDLSGTAGKDASASLGLKAALGGMAAEDEGSASAQVDDHETLCNNLLPRQPIAMQPFQRQLSGPATGRHAGTGRPTVGRAYGDMPQDDPQMEALLHGGDAQPQSEMQARPCERSWQALTDFPADRYGSGQWQAPFQQHLVSKEACLEDSTQGISPKAAATASLPISLRDLQPAREATELRGHESAAEHSCPADWSSEAAEVAQIVTHDASEASGDIQGPSTPAGRAGKDEAKQDTAKHKQWPEMASLLQQDMASLKAQVRPPAHVIAPI